MSHRRLKGAYVNDPFLQKDQSRRDERRYKPDNELLGEAGQLRLEEAVCEWRCSKRGIPPLHDPATTSYRGTVRTSRASGYFFRLAPPGLDAKIEFMNVL